MTARERAEASAILAGSFDAEKFLDLASQYGHGRALGIQYLNAGPNWVKIALPPKPELVGVPESGILATGAIVSLVDTCGGAACWQILKEFKPLVTIDLRLDYLRPAHEGETVIARCECYKMTKSVAFVRGIAYVDEDKPVAHAVATFMVNP